MHAIKLILILLFVSAVTAATIAKSESSPTVSVNRAPMFRPFKLVKLGFILKRVKATTEPANTTTTAMTEKTTTPTLWRNPFILVRPLSSWILVRPPTATAKTTTTATTTTTMATTTTTTRSTVNPTLAQHCAEICERDLYTGRYIHNCKYFKAEGKYRLCYVCRHWRKVCVRGGMLVG